MSLKCFAFRLALLISLLACFCLGLGTSQAAVQPLPGTHALEMQGDLSAQMVAGIGRFLDRETANSRSERKRLWEYDFSSAEAFQRSVEPNREHLRKIVGAVDKRLPVH